MVQAVGEVVLCEYSNDKKTTYLQEFFSELYGLVRLSLQEDLYLSYTYEKGQNI